MGDHCLTYQDIVEMIARLRQEFPQPAFRFPRCGLTGEIPIVTNPFLTEPIPERERLYRGRPIRERKGRLRKKLGRGVPTERPMRGGYLVNGLGIVMHPAMVGRIAP